MRAIVQIEFGMMHPVFEEDRETFNRYHPHQLLEIDIKGPVKSRSLPQLAMYFAFCKLVADNTQDPANWGTKAKVDLQCRIACRWIEGWVVIEGVTQVIPKPLNFKDTDHMEATKYISQAYEEMAAHLGITVDELKKMGRSLKP